MLRDIDVLSRLEQEDARLEATLSKIGLGSDKIKQFWKEWNVYSQTSEPADRDAT